MFENLKAKFQKQEPVSNTVTEPPKIETIDSKIKAPEVGVFKGLQAKYGPSQMTEGIKATPGELMTQKVDGLNVIPAFRPDENGEYLGDKVIKGIENSMLQAGSAMNNVMSKLSNVMVDDENKLEQDTTVTDDVAKLLLGGAGGTFQVMAPGFTLGFAGAENNPITKGLMEKTMGAVEGVSEVMADSGIGDFMTKIGISDEAKSEAFNFLVMGFGLKMLHGGAKKIMAEAPSFSKEIQLKESMVSTYDQNIKTLFGENYDGPMPSKGQINAKAKEYLKEYHPDRPGGDKAKFQEINKARTELLNTEANIKEIDTRIANEIAQAKPGSALGDLRDTMLEAWKITKEAGKEFGDIVTGKKKLQAGVNLEMFGVEVPKTTPEYMNQLKTRLESENATSEIVKQDMQKAIEDNTALEARKDYDPEFAKTIIKIADKYGLPKEAVPQRVAFPAKLNELREKFPNIKVQKLSDDLMEYFKAQMQMEEGAKSIGEDAESLLDAVDTSMKKQEDSVRPDVQMEQIRDYMLNDTPIQSKGAMDKLIRVLEGGKVVENGINYTKNIEAIAQEHLDLQSGKIKEGGEDINDIIERMDKTSQKPVETKAKPITQQKDRKPPSKEQIEYFTKSYERAVTKDLSKTLAKKLKGDSELKRILKKLAESEAYQPNIQDIQDAYGDRRIFTDAMEVAKTRNILNESEYKAMDKMMDTIVKDINKNNAVVNEPGKELTTIQRAVINKRSDWRNPIKGIEDIKVKTTWIDDYLEKNPEKKLHLIDAPTKPESKPFAMMGTKEKTYANVMKPAVMRSIRDGNKSYIEPFGGVGTSLYHLPDYFANGLEEAHINMFDIEKYTIVKAIKEGKMNVAQDVSVAYNTVIMDITKELLNNKYFKEAYDEIGMDSFMAPDVGSKEFREALTLVGFHPELAKKFFKENIDAKLVKNGDITETFKNWLEKDVEQTIKEKFPDLEGNDLEKAIQDGTDEIMNRPDLFEKNYGEMSESIKKVLDKYDSDEYVNGIQGDHMKALMTSVARHFRQRGTSGQRVLSPSDGFNSVEGVLDKMTDTLGRYKATLDQYGDKINIYSEDGKKFINDVSHDLRGREKFEASTWYMDPPYFYSNKMYLKNNPDLKEALAEYSDYEGIKNIFGPAVGQNNSLLFTNDVDGKYFESMTQLLGDRMSNDLYAYKEGLTPTSFITTKNVAGNMTKNKFIYYKLNRNAKINNAVKFIDELGGDMAKKLKTNIAKIISYMSPEMQKNATMLDKIKTGVEKAQMKLEEVEAIVDSVTTGREKQRLLSEIKQQAKQGFLTGKPLINIVDRLNKHIQNLPQKQKRLRDRLNQFKNGHVFDPIIKDKFFEEFYKTYTLEKLTQIEQKGTIKKSILSLDIDELDSIQRQLDIVKEIARKTHDITEKQKEENKNKLAEEFRQDIESGKKRLLGASAGKKDIDIDITSDTDGNWDNFIIDLFKDVRGWVDKNTLFVDNIFEIVGFQKTKRDIDNGSAEAFDTYKETIKDIKEFTNKNKITRKDMIMINNYGSVMRGDGLGKIKILTQLTKIGDPIKYYKSILELKNKEDVQIYLKKKFKRFGTKPIHTLSIEQANKKIESYTRDNYLSPKQKELYKLMRKALDETGRLGAEGLLLVEGKIMNVVPDFRPINSDFQLNNIKENEADYTMKETKEDYSRRTKISQTLDKKTTEKESIPLAFADQTFNRYVNNTIYYAKMQPSIERAKSLFKETEKDMGPMLYKFLMGKGGYIDRLARKGKVSFGTDFIGEVGRGLDKKAGQMSKALVLGNLQSILLQITNVFDAGMANVSWRGVRKTIFKVISDREYSRNILERSPFLRERLGHDRISVVQNTFQDMTVGKLKKVENLMQQGIGAIDMIMGMFANDVTYKQLIKKGYSIKDAEYEADILAKKALGSFSFTDLPEINFKLIGPLKFLSTFSSFVQARYNNLRMNAFGRNRSGWQRTQTLFNFMLTILAETALIMYVGDEMKELLGIKTTEKEFKEEWSKNVADSVPFLRNIKNMFTYGIPILGQTKKAFTSLGNMTKKEKSFRYALGEFIINMGQLKGVAGSLYLGLIIKGKSKPSSNSSKGSMSRGLSNGGLSRGLK